MLVKNRTIDPVAITLTIPAALLCAFIGTGGAYSSEITDRNAKPQLITSSVLSTEFDDGEKFDGNAKKEFQKESKLLQESFNLTITQYAGFMSATRPSVYKWHNLNMPLNKIRSATLNRFRKLQFILSVVKTKNQSAFGEWLRNPLDPLALKANILLKANNLNQDDFIELANELNTSIRKHSDTKNLNKMLGIV